LQRFISEDPIGLAAGDTNFYAYVGNSPLNAIDPLGLYQRDVHYDLTRWLALQVGYSDAAATTIAGANQGIDDSRRTCPILCGEQARADWHFTTDTQLANLWTSALGGSVTDLGQFLHAQQDSFAHAGYGPQIGHIADGTTPDITCRRPELAMTMARDTYNKLRMYMQTKTGLATSDNWDQLQEMVGRKVRTCK
jgi:uncharacterized protein RhaS with RHS repeats